MLSVPAEVTANCCSAVRGCFWSTEMPQMLHVSSIGANGHEWQPIRVGGGSATHPLVHCEPPCATSARASLPRPRHAAAPSPVCVRRCRDSKQAVTLTHKVANQVQKEEEKKSDLPRTCGALEHRRKVRVMVISTPKLKPENRGLRPAMFIKRASIQSNCCWSPSSMIPNGGESKESSPCAAQGSRTNYRTRCGRSLFLLAHTVALGRCPPLLAALHTLVLRSILAQFMA